MQKLSSLSHRRGKILTLVWLFAAWLGWVVSAGAQVPPLLAGATQMLLATTADWDTCPGTLYRFSRVDTNAAWTQAGEAIPIVVGRNGLSWGIKPPMKKAAPMKKEGDGKSPAGIFRLSSAFGFAAPEKMSQIKLPYQQLTDAIECVDDVRSTNYNRVVDRAKISQPDWSSSEKMKQVGQYRLGVVVDHNVDPREAGGGSCIFLHIWKDATTGTSGCTAMAAENIDLLVPWLDPAAQPVLVQLPNAEYHKLRAKWNLP